MPEKETFEPARSGHIKVENGTRKIYWEYFGEGQKEVVVLLNGLAMLTKSWYRTVPFLHPEYDMLLYDYFGQGQSSQEDEPYYIPKLAEYLVQVMDALGIEKAAVVGHDWGGIIAFKVAIDWPDRVTRLALLDTLCTVWIPMGVHGYWFKAAPLPEELFAAHHDGFIETLFAGRAKSPMPGRPQSPWADLGGTQWASAETVDEYKRAFADPLSQQHAISYYRDALPFHIVTPDASATHGEKFQYLSPQEVASMWLNPQGLEQHPLYANFMDYGPEDRHKRFAKPVSNASARDRKSSEIHRESKPACGHCCLFLKAFCSR